MVVLNGVNNMFVSGRDQYLQPDYLSPLPTTLDAKKSPLALLAQTCSQIGADSKAVVSSDKSSKEDDKKSRSSNTSSQGGNSSSNGVNSKEGSKSKSKDNSSPAVSACVTPHSVSGDETSPRTKSPSSNSDKPSGSDNKSVTSPASKSETNAPIIRSGLEVLQGHPKDIPLGTYRAGFLPPGLSGFVYPGDTSSLLRHPLSGLSLLPPSSFASSLASDVTNPYLNFARLKAGEVSLPTVCRDPSCRSCQFGLGHLSPTSGTCPSGCTQCDHQKAMHLLPGGGGAANGPGFSASAQGPYVCNWIAGSTYCGKRFSTSEELLQHLRTHTSLTVSDPSSSALLASPYMGSLPPSTSSSLYRSPYSSSSSLSDLRYHPYGKPPSTPLGISSAPPLSSLPMLYPALAAYYAPYSSLYGP